MQDQTIEAHATAVRVVLSTRLPSLQQWAQLALLRQQCTKPMLVCSLLENLFSLIKSISPESYPTNLTEADLARLRALCQLYLPSLPEITQLLVQLTVVEKDYISPIARICLCATIGVVAVEWATQVA